MLRSVLSVILGYLSMSVLVIGMFAVWALVSGYRENPDLLPGTQFLIGAEVWGIGAAAVAAFVTIRVARRAPLAHVVALLTVGWLALIASLVLGDYKEPVVFQVAHFPSMLIGFSLGYALHARRVAR